MFQIISSAVRTWSPSVSCLKGFAISGFPAWSSRLRAVALLTVLTLSLAITHVSAQSTSSPPIPASNFASTHFWGSPQAISTQHLALGSAYAADWDNFSIGQPASIPAVRRSEVLYQYGKSDFVSLPTFVSSYSAFIKPLDRTGDTVMLIAIATVDGNGQVKGGAVPLSLRSNETDTGIIIGHRVSNRLEVGVATGYLGTRSQYDIPGNVQLERIHSAPKLTPGGRIGMVYRITPHISLGATYDNYTEAVTIDPTAQSREISADYHSVAYRVGIAWHPDSHTMLLLDRTELGLHGGGTTLARRNTSMGAERKIGPISVRVGLFERRFTGGLGLGYRGLKLAYAFTNQYTDSLPNTGAKTGHNVQVSASF